MILGKKKKPKHIFTAVTNIKQTKNEKANRELLVKGLAWESELRGGAERKLSTRAALGPAKPFLNPFPLALNECLDS